MFGLLHGDMGWVIAGLVAFTGLMFFLVRLMRGRIFESILSVCVWFFMFSIHGGSTQGIMTATLVALLFDTIGLPILKAFYRGGKT